MATRYLGNDFPSIKVNWKGGGVDWFYELF